MSELCKINVSMLKSYENDFNKEQSNFNTRTYSTFSSSYLKSCSDPYVSRMAGKLQALYDKLKIGYQNTDKWWTDYNDNIEALENYLSDNGSVGAIKESSVRNSANKLPNLKKYNINYSGVITSNVSASYETSFTESNVTPIVDSFSSLYSSYDVSNLNTSIITDNDDIIGHMDEDILGAFLSSGDVNVITKTALLINGVDNFFNETGARISKKFDNLWDNTIEWWNHASEVINEVGSKITDKAESLLEKASSWWSDVEDWWNDDALPAIKTAANTVWGVIKSVGATVAVFVQSLVEGILQFVEAIIDFVALVGTGVASIVTGLYDGGQAIYGAITGNEWSSVTKQMWSGTMGFVSTQYVTGWFDSLYQDTGYGQWLANNAYGFDITRSIGTGIGYIAGVVILTIATFGAGSVVAAGGSVTASTAAAATTATQMAVTATAAGIGRGTQNAWADGADLLEGLTAGTLTGLWEGLQFYIGGKIGSMNLFGSEGLLKAIGSNGIGTKLLNGLARVILDGVDGGVEGFVVPLISSIYKDGYYDEEGNYVEFTGSESIIDRYKEIFDDSGGWSNVWTQAVIGSSTSLIGELFDLRKYFKDEKSKVVDPNATLELDSAAARTRKTITKKIKRKREVYTPIANLEDPAATLQLGPVRVIDRKEQEKVINDFLNAMYSDQLSNVKAVNLMYNTFDKAMDNGNIEAYYILKTFVELKNQNPNLKIVIGNGSDCYWNDFYKAIVIGPQCVEMQDSGTICHELGHCLYDSILGGKLPDNWNHIVKRAQKISSKGRRSFISPNGNAMDSVCDSLRYRELLISDDSLHILRKDIHDSVGLTLEEYQKVLAYKYSNMLNGLTETDVRNMLTAIGLNEKVIDKIISEGIDPLKIAEADLNVRVRKISDEIYRTQYPQYCAISDMIGAVYKGEKYDLKGKPIYTTYGHSAEYYKLRPKNCPFHELIANFNALKMLGSNGSLSALKSMFGEEFYNVLEDTFNKFCNYK